MSEEKMYFVQVTSYLGASSGAAGDFKIDSMPMAKEKAKELADDLALPIHEDELPASIPWADGSHVYVPLDKLRKSFVIVRPHIPREERK
jgi:hypothetical protein